MAATGAARPLPLVELAKAFVDTLEDARLCASSFARATSFAASLLLVSSLSMSSCLPFSRSSRSSSSARRSSNARCSRSCRSASSSSLRYCAYCSSRSWLRRIVSAFSCLYLAMRASVSCISMSLIRLNAKHLSVLRCLGMGVQSDAYQYLQLPPDSHYTIANPENPPDVC